MISHSNQDHRLGAMPLPNDSGTSFRVWAPRRRQVTVEILRGDQVQDSHQLTKELRGFFSGIVKSARPGDHYWYRLDDEVRRPDPASRFQPDGVHQPSRIVDPSAYQWSDSDWLGRQRDDLVIYEVHVGTFTETGTFAGVKSRLDELIDLGVTALEIMPVAATPGRWNWGYDGVYFFAPSHAYGSPEEFKDLVNACHRKGLAVILDVVYNHIGPEGNYLAEFAPYFSRKHRTPWGEAFDFDGVQSGPVREFILENVRHWLVEFHLDGLRLDAIRLMFDDSDKPIVSEIATVVGQLRKNLNRPIHLIAEANVYDPNLLEVGYDAIWSDEIPHAIQSSVLGQARVATRQYDGAEDLAESLDRGFLYEFEQGTIVRSTEDARGDLRGIVHGLQTHDQVGNHPLGKRLADLSGVEAQKAAAALMILYPAIPFIFMGEEFATSSPFCFFVDYTDEPLRKAVVEGRKRDYDHHDWNEFVSPLSEDAFLRSKLPSASEGDAQVLKWYRDLIRLRQEWRASGILDPATLTVKSGADWVLLDYRRAWVAVRLASTYATPMDRIDLGLGGRIILNSAGSNLDSSLGLNEAVVGTSD